MASLQIKHDIYNKKPRYSYRITRLFFMLFYLDSNQDKQDQNLLCYHYTIEQSLQNCQVNFKRCSTWIRTRTNRTRICCATITP